MELRQAGPADENRVCDLWTQLMSFYNKKPDPAVLQRSYRYALSHPQQVRVFVAVLEGVVAATASLHQGHYSTWNDNWYGHIEDVIVDPFFRGRGVGEALVRHIVSVAEKLGLSRVELNALMDNKPARDMYEKIGFKTDSVVYELSVASSK